MIENLVNPLEKPRIKLEFLDGLRGCAAFYVLLFHIHLNTNFKDLPHWFQAIQGNISYGHYAVCIFIVLSGFCLMLPVATSSDGILRGGIENFMRRRARRILPPYFAALFFSFLWVLFFEGMKARSGHDNSLKIEFSAGNTMSHLLLIFNWFPLYWGATNGALWSVATEWQIYFIFALIILPFWRCFGNFNTILFAFIIGVAPHYLLPKGALLNAFDLSCSWFLGLFALGMVGAVLRFGEKSAHWIPRFPWGSCCAVITSILVTIAVIYKPVDNPWSSELIRHYTWITDSLCGLAALSLILFCSYHPDAVIVKLLRGRFPMALGAFSFSLYLVHDPVLVALQYIAWHSHSSSLAKALFMWIAGITISIGLAILFSRFFERRSFAFARPTPKKLIN